MDIQLSRRTVLGAGTAAGVAAVAGVGLPSAFAAPAQPAGIDRAFDEAARRFNVPRDVLVGLAAAETGLDNHGGAPSSSGAFGVTALTQNPGNTNLTDAARLTGTDPEKLKRDDAANIAGTAALLAARADQLRLSAGDRRNVEAWHPVLASHARAASGYAAMQYADAVYDAIAAGVDDKGVKVAATQTEPNRTATVKAADQRSLAVATADAATATTAVWVPAHSNNYTVANRPTDLKITHVVIHMTQGSYASAISWFQNPSATVSAHYVIRSSDGAATQMVRQKDIAWHAGNWNYNQHSIGIEHEGFVTEAKWFTDAMYRSSAAITRTICKAYGIPMDRTHIISHKDVPGSTHTDPGPYWDWNKYMAYVVGGNTPSWSQEVDNETAGRFTASANWGLSSYDSQRHGAHYRYAKPQDVSDPAWFKFNVPAKGVYRVESWYSAGTGYSSAAPHLIATTSGMKTVVADQTTGGGAWKSLGNFTLAAGDRNVVGVSRWTSAPGLVLADAIRLTRVS